VCYSTTCVCALLKDFKTYKKYNKGGIIPLDDVVEVRHGRWINNHCTVCGMTPIGEEEWTRLGLTPPKFELCMSFCPCCGAKMDGERKEK
jgi:hypothetical protein